METRKILPWDSVIDPSRKNIELLVFCANFVFSQRSCLREELSEVTVLEENVSGLLPYNFALGWHTNFCSDCTQPWLTVTFPNHFWITADWTSAPVSLWEFCYKPIKCPWKTRRALFSFSKDDPHDLMAIQLHFGKSNASHVTGYSKNSALGKCWFNNYALSSL